MSHSLGNGHHSACQEMTDVDLEKEDTHSDLVLKVTLDRGSEGNCVLWQCTDGRKALPHQMYILYSPSDDTSC